MALDSDNVRVAVTGAVYVAPSGTTLPTHASQALNVAFEDVGYISEDGVTESQASDTTDIKAWQNSAIVRKVQTSHDLTYQFTMIETNGTALELFYGNYAAGAIEVDGALSDRQCMVLDVVDGSELLRVVAPAAQVTDRGDVSYTSGDAVGRQVTVTCYPDDSGIKAYIYLTEDSGT